MRADEFADVLVGEGIAERQHRHRVLDLAEFSRRGADARATGYPDRPGPESASRSPRARAQRIIGGIRDGWRVMLIVAPVMLGDLAGEARELGRSLLLGQIARPRQASSAMQRHGAREISRSAAARASLVTLAPTSMRAISSRRLWLSKGPNARDHPFAIRPAPSWRSEMRWPRGRDLRRMGDGDRPADASPGGRAASRRHRRPHRRRRYRSHRR